MSDELTLRVIARLYNDFPTKFGLPRQSGLAPSMLSTVVFEPEFRISEALRGIEDYSHLWLLWGFSGVDGWSPTVRPPRLGGNRRVGVFATRSPFRPNPVGLTCVKLEKMLNTHGSTALIVSGADIMSGSPVYDIKPYIPYADSMPDAAGSFSDSGRLHVLKVCFPDSLLMHIPAEKQKALFEALSADPRPAYQHDPERVYGFLYAGFDVRFTVDGDILTVREIIPAVCE